MSLVAAPYGLKPIATSGSGSYSGGTVREYRITQNNTYIILTNSWVTMNAGKIDGPSSNIPVSKLNNVAPSATASPLGVVTGIRYTDPTMKYSLWAQSLPAAAVNAGYTNISVYVNIDPQQLYLIQATGAIAQASIGLNLDMGAETGTAVTGLSNIACSGPAATVTLPLRLIDLVNQSSIFGGNLSTPNDAYTDCIVKWNECTLTIQNQTGV